jgi:hypothetical protein
VTLAALLARGCDGSQAAAQIDALQGRRSRADAARGRAEGRGLSSLEFEEGGTRGVRIMVERDEDSSDEEDNCTTQDVEFQAAASFNGVREGLELQSNIMTAVAPDYIDHTKSSKFIADLLQICQAWLPLFWSLIPPLMEIQQHDDKVTPIKSLLFEEMKGESVFGKDLGTVVESQASQLWLVVARGNVESMPA